MQRLDTRVSLNHMYSVTRQRETIFLSISLIIIHVLPVKTYPGVYDRNEDTRIEGGDELVLSKDVLAVGISQRTDAASIEKQQKIFCSRHELPKNLSL